MLRGWALGSPLLVGEGWEAMDRAILCLPTVASGYQPCQLTPQGVRDYRACLPLIPGSLSWFGVCFSGLNGPGASSLPLGLWGPGPCPAQPLLWAPSVCPLTTQIPGRSVGPQVGVSHLLAPGGQKRITLIVPG